MQGRGNCSCTWPRYTGITSRSVCLGLNHLIVTEVKLICTPVSDLFAVSSEDPQPLHLYFRLVDCPFREPLSLCICASNWLLSSLKTPQPLYLYFRLDFCLVWGPLIICGAREGKQSRRTGDRIWQYPKLNYPTEAVSNWFGMLLSTTARCLWSLMDGSVFILYFNYFDQKK